MLLWTSSAPSGPDPVPDPSSPAPPARVPESVLFSRRHTDGADTLVAWFEQLGAGDVSRVGGKAASLGEMYRSLSDRGVRVPNGFATTVDAWAAFLDAAVPSGSWADVAEEERACAPQALEGPTLRGALERIFRDFDASDQLELHARAALARALVARTPVPEGVADGIREAHGELTELYGSEADLAVRSSATCEDSEMASFAGQYESYLNVRGIDAVLEAWRKCCASAFTERALGYQIRQGMDPLASGLGVVIMKMVRSDLAASGVMFTLDPDSGNPNVIHLTSAYGLGELVVQGSVSPDTIVVWKEGIRRGRPAVVHRSLGAKDRKLVYSIQGGTATESVDVQASHQRQWSITNDEAIELACMALSIEEHYGGPVDIEWAKDGYTGELFVVQARPETVHRTASAAMLRYRMDRSW